MQDSVIVVFLEGRKQDYLKKNLKSGLSEEGKLVVQSDANAQFALANWLPKASVRATQLSLVSHPAKFSHPGAKTTPVIAKCIAENDGYVRSGNLGNLALDVIGNAAAMDVYQFLMLILKNGKTILENLEQNTNDIQSIFNATDCDYNVIRSELLQIKSVDSEQVKTSGSVKQVYFPIDDTDYHLLSILTPSAAIYQLKEKINFIRFSDQAKEAREARKKNHFKEHGLAQIVGLAGIGYGGTKPQNISVINSKNGGVALLLSSMPPELNKRKINPPKIDFFDLRQQWLAPFEDQFIDFHRILTTQNNNVKIRNKRDYLIELVQILVADNVNKIRKGVPLKWSNGDYYQNLIAWQKIWLDEQYLERRAEDNTYLEHAAQGFARWFMNVYTLLLEKNNLKKHEFDDLDLSHVRTQALKNKALFL